MTLPTTKCLPDRHARSGGCYYCCPECDYDQHRCHFCGDELLHNDVDPATELTHDCYVECLCGHIGHEHSSDDTCRGTEFTDLRLVETDCYCTSYRPNREQLVPRHKREENE